MDNVEAMYTIEFASDSGGYIGHGYGVVIFETGRIFGGDSSFVYIGKFHVENGIVLADVHCKNDREVEGLVSIFADGEDEFDLHLEGVIAFNEFVLKGYKVNDQSKKITVKLTRRAELPQ